jgi:phosphatidylglycerophosphatase A
VSLLNLSDHAGDHTKPRVARPTARFMWGHPARWLALGFGSGLSPWAPGTVGTLWGWVSFVVLNRWLDAAAWGVLIALSLAVGVWACTRTAQHMAVADPGAIVWDEIVAFWIVLWVLLPAGFWAQVAAFALFRYFDAAKPGPVRWADQLYKLQPGQAIGWRQGWGILFDDLVAALCTLLFIAVWVQLWNS